MTSSQPSDARDSVAALGQDRQTQVQKIRAIVANDTTGNPWDAIWKQNVTPWDQGVVQRSLREFVESNKVTLPTSGKALVPGCGRGYEAVYLATKLGLETTGMDISETAVEEANKNLKVSDIPQDTKISFKTASFFDYRFDNDEESYDLCLDYTFFVALPPTLRPSWGSQMRHLVKKGGYLITLIWPIDGDRPGGPPYSVDVGMYTEALQADPGSGNWTKIFDEATNHPDRKGTERIAVWKRE